MKSAFACFMDNIFTVMVVFLFVFVTTRKFVHNIIFIIIITFVVTFFISLFIIIFFDKKRSKNMINQKIKTMADNFYSNLLFGKKYQVLCVIKNCLKNFDAKIKFGSVWYTGNKDYIIVPQITVNPVTPKDYIYIYNKYKKYNRTILILSKEQTKECKTFIAIYDIDIHFVRFDVFFEKFCTQKNVNFVPLKKQKGKNIKDFLSFALSRNQTKRYFFLMALFSVYSFLYRYNLYYVFFCFLTGVLTIISLKNTKYNIGETVDYFA